MAVKFVLVSSMIGRLIDLFFLTVCGFGDNPGAFRLWGVSSDVGQAADDRFRNFGSHGEMASLKN